jgi:hypothetical protein
MVTILNTKTGQTKGQGAKHEVATNEVRSKINMYNEHPQNIISLHEFHSIALNRL